MRTAVIKDLLLPWPTPVEGTGGPVLVLGLIEGEDRPRYLACDPTNPPVQGETWTVDDAGHLVARAVAPG